MKFNKVLLFSLLTLAGVGLSAQNLQLHYDTRHSLHKEDFGKNYATATFEMFKPDKWGSTFMFVDLDFSADDGNIGLAYTEISRDQKLGNLPISAHIEFNGGTASWGPIKNAYLAGVSYGKKVGTFNLSTYLTYKYNAFTDASHDIQWTGTWGGNFANDKLTFCGFIDIWTENKTQTKSDAGKKVVLLTEPQLWYNITSNLSAGSEIEISNNFIGNKFYINPTIAAKWNF